MALPQVVMAAIRAIGSLFGAEGTAAATGARTAGTEMVFNPAKFHGPYADPSKAVTPASITTRATPPPVPNATQENAKKFNDRMKGLGDTFGKVNQQVAFAQYNLHAAGGIFESSSKRFVHSMTFAIDTLAASAAPFVALVSKNNPGVSRQFEIALNDAYGVLGRLLIPIVVAFTDDARKLGNTMASLEPVFTPAIVSIAHFVEVFGDQVSRVAERNSVIFTDLAVAMENTAKIATVLLTVFDAIGPALIFLEPPLLKWMRILGGREEKINKDATSLGAGTRTSQVTQPKEISDNAIKYAISLGVGQQDKAPPEKGQLDEIIQWLKDIYKALPELPELSERGSRAARNLDRVGNGIATINPALGLLLTRVRR